MPKTLAKAKTPVRTNALKRVAGGYERDNVSKAAIKMVAPFIEQHEGFRDKAYWDVDGWAVGHGHRLIKDPKTGKMRKVQSGDAMDKATSSALVRERLKQNAASMYKNLKWSRTLSPGALAALYDIAFNAGPETLYASKSPSLNRSMNAPGANRDEIVWRELPTYRKSGGKVVKGLENRRADAALAFRLKPSSTTAPALDSRRMLASR